MRKTKKKICYLFAAFLCLAMNVQLNATETYLYDNNGIRYVLIEMTFADATSRSAYVVHPETTIEEEDPAIPSSYTGVIVIEDTIRYEGNDFPVKFINDNAFLQSTITSIDLPEAITVFNSGAFRDCQTLRTIICRAETPPSTRIHSIAWDYADVFGSLDPDQVSVYVPKGTVMMYQEAGGWDAFSHYYTIDMIQSVEEVTGDGLQVTGKIMRDGLLYIEHDGKIYNAQGAQVR